MLCREIGRWETGVRNRRHEVTFYLVDDDRQVLNQLEMIIERSDLGEVIGRSEDPVRALATLTAGVDGTFGAGSDGDDAALRPDIIIVDFLMPGMDGETFVRKASPQLPDTVFIMLSQVTDKSMVASAYEAGVMFFIQKPVNAIEVTRVLKNAVSMLTMQRKMTRMQEIFLMDDRPADELMHAEAGSADPKAHRHRLRRILQRIGIIGEAGSQDIEQTVMYLLEHEDVAMRNQSVNEFLGRFTDTPKSMEQRIRRAASVGLTNLAGMGLDDYMNDTFQEYAGALYGFEQVRTEMTYLKTREGKGGNVRVWNFLCALAVAAADEY